MRLKSSPEYREAATSSWLERDRSAYVGGLLSGSILVIVLRLEQRIRVREAFVSLTRLRGCGASRSFGSFGQEFFDVLVSVVALTDFHQAGKMEFHPSFDLTRRNVVTTRFQTLRQLFGTPEHAHRLAVDIHLEKKRVALTASRVRSVRYSGLLSRLEDRRD